MGQADREKNRSDLSKYLGQTMTMVVDRPIGYVHKGIRYPVNYGYIPGTLACDGEPQDVYLLGVGIPMGSFTGRIVGIVHRLDDEEDKLVMAPEGARFFRHEIERQVQFQERYFHTKVESVWEKSCGAIVYRRGAGGIEYLCLLQLASWGYSVPKGHMEGWETEEETACREVLEESGLKVKLLPGFRERMEYSFIPGKYKELVLFLAEGEGSLSLQREEIRSGQWLPLEKVLELLHPDYAPIMQKAEAFLKELLIGKEGFVE